MNTTGMDGVERVQQGNDLMCATVFELLRSVHELKEVVEVTGPLLLGGKVAQDSDKRLVRE